MRETILSGNITIDIVVTLIIFAAISLAGHGLWKSIPYACFIFAGVTVAHFQYEIHQHIKDTLYVYEHLGEIINVVAIAGVIGILFSFEYLFTDRFLPLIIGMTVLLGISQALSWIYIISGTLLNVYALVYALIAISLPFISLVWRRHTQRVTKHYGVGILAALFIMGSPAIGFLMATDGKWIGLISFVLSILTGIAMGILIFRRK